MHPNCSFAILQKASGLTALDFATQHLFEPLGIEGVSWSHDPQGITSGGAQIRMRPDDALKIGLLYLNNGEYDSKQIVSANWISESTKRHSAGGFYGSIVAPEANAVAVFNSSLPLEQMSLPKRFFKALTWTLAL